MSGQIPVFRPTPAPLSEPDRIIFAAACGLLDEAAATLGRAVALLQAIGTAEPPPGLDPRDYALMHAGDCAARAGAECDCF